MLFWMVKMIRIDKVSRWHLQVSLQIGDRTGGMNIADMLKSYCIDTWTVLDELEMYIFWSTTNRGSEQFAIRFSRIVTIWWTCYYRLQLVNSWVPSGCLSTEQLAESHFDHSLPLHCSLGSSHHVTRFAVWDNTTVVFFGRGTPKWTVLAWKTAQVCLMLESKAN